MKVVTGERAKQNIRRRKVNIAGHIAAVVAESFPVNYLPSPFEEQISAQISTDNVKVTGQAGKGKRKVRGESPADTSRGNKCHLWEIFVEAQFSQSKTSAGAHENYGSNRANKYVMLLSNFWDENRGLSQFSEK